MKNLLLILAIFVLWITRSKGQESYLVFNSNYQVYQDKGVEERYEDITILLNSITICFQEDGKTLYCDNFEKTYSRDYLTSYKKRQVVSYNFSSYRYVVTLLEKKIEKVIYEPIEGALVTYYKKENNFNESQD